MEIAPQQNLVHEARDARKQLRRMRGEIACSECRRLRIRCNRKVPCTSCIRRGYSSICPNGTPAAKRTTVDTNQLLADLDKAHTRIRQLEDALRASHAAQSSSNPSMPEATSNGMDDDLLEIFGTLTIADGGESRFLGPSATTENFLLSEIANSDHTDKDANVPPFLSQLSQMWPFSPESHSTVALQEHIESQLPSYGRASSLCEAFFQNLAWFLQPISRAQIMEKLLPIVYRRKRNNPSDNSPRIDIRYVALIFVVFACGAVGDLTQEPNNEEGQKYKSLARSALGLSSVLTRASLSSVQTMILLGLYNICAAREENQEESWKIISLAMSTSTSLGLRQWQVSFESFLLTLQIDRDPGRWELSADVQEDRRLIFWEVYSLESSRAMSSGRPPVIPLKAIDVKYPQSVRGGEDTFWKYEFMRRCLAPVAERFCADAAPVKYHEVLDFDARIREFENEMAQKSLRVDGDHDIEPMRLFKTNVAYIHCETVRIRIHLNFFALAVMDCPDDPLRSPFVHSFQAAFRGAMTFLRVFEVLTDTNMPLMLRIWPLWSNTFISAVIIGTVAFHCPAFDTAELAFTTLGFAISAFRKGEKHPIVTKGLPILLNIKEKAHRALSSVRASHRGVVVDDAVSIGLNSSQGDAEGDELAILQGLTRIVAQKEDSLKPTPAPATCGPSYQGGQGEYQTPQYTDPSTAMRNLGSEPSDVYTFQNALSDWTMEMDALRPERLDGEHLALPSVRTATEDGAFASLGIESLFPPATNGSVGYNTMESDAWYLGENIMQDSAGLFGDWNF